MTGSFGARLAAALDERAPVCVGIDPHAALLEAWGLPDDASGVERFGRTCVEALGSRVAALKPQSAFFERHGSAGVAALERTVAAAREAGALVVMDAKRGDIGSTMAAYAEAYLDAGSPLLSDALTVNPYLGVGALEPAFRAAERSGSGLFVLCLTSNAEGVELQRATTRDGRSVARTVLDEADSYNRRAHDRDAAPLGSFGVVVGATIGDAGVDLGAFTGPFLVPGIGAQGGTAADVARLFGPSVRQVLASASREVLRHGPDPASIAAAAEDFAATLRTLRA